MLAFTYLTCYQTLIIFIFFPVPIPVVGLQVAESVVNETVDNKFTCIEIISGGPLRFDATITFYTQDGSATGELD